MPGSLPKITVTDVSDAADDYFEGDADDEYFGSQDGSSQKSTRTISTFTQTIIVSEEVTTPQGSRQATGQVTDHLTEQIYTSEAVATNPTGGVTGKPTSQRVKVSQATGEITGKLPASKDAKQVKISGQVTEVSTTQELAGPSGPGIALSTPQSTRTIRKAISAILDGSHFRSWSSHKYEELSKSTQSTPQPKPRSQTAADPPRPPMLGYEWVWFPAGYWAEREVITQPKKRIRPPRWVRRSLQESRVSTHDSPVPSAPRSLTASEVWIKHPGDIEDEKGLCGDPQEKRAGTPEGRTSPDKETFSPKSLLRKLQQISQSGKASVSGRSIRKGKEPEEPRPESPPIDLERRTTNTLRGTSHFFAQFLAMKRQNDREMQQRSPMRPLSPGAKSLQLPRKRFGLAPWHQNASGDTVRTTTSSIRNLLFGKTPVSTPQPGAALASKPDQYFGLEVPGSRTVDDWPPPNPDAQQDNTTQSPDQGTLENRRQSAIGSPFTQVDDSGPSTLSKPSSESSTSPLMSRVDRARLRYRESEASSYRHPLPPASERGNFATELTEHLQGSPLCPLHPDYTSPGKGYCPYHSPPQRQTSGSVQRMRHGL